MNKINYKAVNRLVAVLMFLVILTILKLLNLLDNTITIISALTPFYLAFLIIWIMKPFSNWLQEKFKIEYKKANLIAILVNLVCVVGFLFLIIPILIVQVWEITQNSTSIINNISANLQLLFSYINMHQTDIFKELQQMASEIFNIKSIPDLIKNFDFSIVSGTLTTIFSVVGGISSFVLNFVFAYILAIYLSSDFDAFVEKLLNLLFKKSTEKNKKVFIESTKAINGYFKGLLIDCSFVVALVTIGAALIGIPSPLLFGLIAGIFNVIPYLGPILGGIPLIFIAFANGIPTVILALIVVFGTQFVESQILQPRIMAKSINLHPITVITGLIIFGTLFGFVGMLIASPTLAVISVIIKNSDLDIRI